MIYNSQSIQCSVNEQINLKLDFQMQDQSPKYLSPQENRYISSFLFEQIDLNQGNRESQHPNNKSNTKLSLHQNQEVIANNIQKHIFVTIKQLLQLNTKVSDENIKQSMEILWKAFINSSKKSKQSLRMLFGVFDQNSEQDLRLLRSLNLDISLFLNADTIRNAQNLIRVQAIQQLTEEMVIKHIERRRMKEKKKFIGSVLKFMNNLKKGPLRKRKQRRINKYTRFGY